MMLRISALLSISLLLFSIISCTSDKKITVKASTNSGVLLKDAVLELDNPDFLAKIRKSFSDVFEIRMGDKLLPFQKIDADLDGKTDKLLVICDLEPKQTAELNIQKNSGENPGFKKRTQAELSVKEGGNWEYITKKNGNQQFEYIGGSFKNINHLRVPDQHTDHSFYIRYEGPGWESDKIGYRFYIDWRNATDIYGKRIPDMVLQDVGLEDFEAYHELSDWGMDVLKVGGSLGIGSFGYWNGEKAIRVENTDSIDCTITQNGIIRSSIETNYFGWSDPTVTTNLKSTLSIDAGSRLTHVQLSSSEALDNLCTGIVKHEETGILENAPNDGDWAYLATYGPQSLNNDNLGMAVFYRQSDLIKLAEDEESYVIVLSPSTNALEYYFAAVWELDVDGITNGEVYKTYLDETLDRLNNPVKISY